MDNNPACMICLKKCVTRAKLQLLCECRPYIVHYRCMKAWYRANPVCIICKKNCNQPLPTKIKGKIIHYNDKKIKIPIKLTLSIIYLVTIIYINYKLNTSKYYNQYLDSLEITV